MPIVQFKDHQGNELRGKKVPYPKNIQRPESWITEIRKVIPSVPDPRKTDWYVATFDASREIILIELLNSIGQRCRIGIIRESGMTAVPTQETGTR